MRTIVLVLAVAIACVILGSCLRPGEARVEHRPTFPWRLTEQGWVPATWLPLESVPPVAISPGDTVPAVPAPSPVQVPHPLFLAAIQILAVAYAAVAEWQETDGRNKGPVTAKD